MTTFAGSPNSRHFVGVRDDTMFFTRDDKLVWEKQVPFDVFTLVGVSNNGHSFFHAPEGIYVYDITGAEVEAPVARWSRATLAQTSSQLAAVRASADGRVVCVERATLQARISQKIFEFLSASKVKPNTTLHEVFLYNLVERTESSFYRCMASTKNPQPFLWDISLDFSWIVLAEPEKSGTQIRFSVAHVPSQTIYHEFTIADSRVNAIKVSRDGTTLVDVTQKGERALVVVTLDSVKYAITVPSVEFEIRHLGRDFVALVTRPTPFLLIKGFDDRLVSQADLRSLERLKVEYDVSFNERDALDLISVRDGNFKVVHTNVEYLETDAKRWEQAADALEAEEEARLRPPSEPPRPAVQRPQRLDLGANSQTPYMPAPPHSHLPEPTAAPPPVDPHGLSPIREVARTYLPHDEAPAAPPRRPAPPSAPIPPVEPPVQAPSRSAPPAPTPAERPIPPAPSVPPPPPRPTAIPSPAKTSPRMIEPPSRPPAASGSAETRIAPAASASTETRQASTSAPDASPVRSQSPESAAPPALPPLPTSGKSPKGIPPPPRPTAPVGGSSDGAERKRVERLLALLEERFSLGQVSEATYHDLKSKYTARLGEGV